MVGVSLTTKASPCCSVSSVLTELHPRLSILPGKGAALHWLAVLSSKKVQILT